jgi:hypothetical protein
LAAAHGEAHLLSGPDRAHLTEAHTETREDSL